MISRLMKEKLFFEEKKISEHFQDFLSRMNVFDGIFVFFSALHIPVNQKVEKNLHKKIT